jgi:PAS domain S-box-containing protein
MPVAILPGVDQPLNDRLLRESVMIAADAIICVDDRQRIILFNLGAATIFGYEPSEVLGKPLDVLLPKRVHGAHRAYVEGFSHARETSRLMGERREVSGLRKDGSEFPAEASIARVGIDDKVAYSVVLRDITERQRFEQENAELVRDLRGAVSARDDMLSIVSHDLRNPVNAVKMLAAAILRAKDVSDVPADVAQHAQVMLEAARQMDSLIQDLLDVSKLESGRMAVSPRVVAIGELVAQASETLMPIAAQATISLQTPIGGGELPLVDVDPDRIVQVLSNLIGNAIKYTQPGGDVRVLATADQDVVRVSVVDTGVGIAEHELPRVFDRFWQSKRTNRSGAGLGLAIARGIVRAHGGRIWIESVVGKGTRVHFTVPRAAKSAVPARG